VTANRLSLTPAVVALFTAPALAASAGAATPGAASDQPTVGATAELIPRLWRSCTNYNKRYPHGVGRLRARDRVRPGNEPVTTFRRSTRIYNIAMDYNKGLDRDKDGVACEKR
jgi:Excalibur calcium-binding domain